MPEVQEGWQFTKVNSKIRTSKLCVISLSFEQQIFLNTQKLLAIHSHIAARESGFQAAKQIFL